MLRAAHSMGLHQRPVVGVNVGHLGFLADLSLSEFESQIGAIVEGKFTVDDQLMYKAQFGASMDTSAQKDMQGVTGVTLKGTVAMSKFDEPVDVTAPAGAGSP